MATESVQLERFAFKLALYWQNHHPKSMKHRIFIQQHTTIYIGNYITDAKGLVKPLIPFDQCVNYHEAWEFSRGGSLCNRKYNYKKIA